MQKVKAVGFDLDGTLYKSTPEMDDRIRVGFAWIIARDYPDQFPSVEKAREYFEGRYSELQSGTAVLRELGYESETADQIRDSCLVNADTLDLLRTDRDLAALIHNIQHMYVTYLLTSSPRELGIQKLERLGIDSRFFEYAFYGDTFNGSKSSGEAFKYVLSVVGFTPGKHIYIGDRRKSDILPAKKLGMGTIAVWSEIPEADFSVPTIYDIEDLLL